MSTPGLVPSLHCQLLLFSMLEKHNIQRKVGSGDWERSYLLPPLADVFGCILFLMGHSCLKQLEHCACDMHQSLSLVSLDCVNLFSMYTLCVGKLPAAVCTVCTESKLPVFLVLSEFNLYPDFILYLAAVEIKSG